MSIKCVDNTMQIGNFKMQKKVVGLNFVKVTITNYLGNDIIINCIDTGTIIIYYVNIDKCYELVGHTRRISSIIIKHNLVISGSYDTTIRIWDITTGECLRILEGHKYSISVMYNLVETNITKHNNDEQNFQNFQNLIVSGSKDSTIRIWNVYSGECIHILKGHTEVITKIIIKDNLLISKSHGKDNTIRIWDILTGECVRILDAHTNYYVLLHVIDDLIVTISECYNVCIWNLYTGECIADPYKNSIDVDIQSDETHIFRHLPINECTPDAKYCYNNTKTDCPYKNNYISIVYEAIIDCHCKTRTKFTSANNNSNNEAYIKEIQINNLIFVKDNTTYSINASSREAKQNQKRCNLTKICDASKLHITNISCNILQNKIYEISLTCTIRDTYINNNYNKTTITRPGNWSNKNINRIELLTTNSNMTTIYNNKQNMLCSNLIYVVNIFDFIGIRDAIYIFPIVLFEGEASIFKTIICSYEIQFNLQSIILQYFNIIA